MVELASVHEAVKALDPHPLSRPELCGRITDLERLRSRIDERLMAHKEALDALGDAGADASMVGRSLARRSERPAKRDMITARGLAEMPQLATSLAEGQLNVEHAAIVADAAEQVTPEVAAELVTTAESMPADIFATRGCRECGATIDRYHAHHENRTGHERREHKQRRRRAQPYQATTGPQQRQHNT